MSYRTAIYDLMNNVESDVYPLVAPAELTVPYAVYTTRREPIRVQEGVSVWTTYLTIYIYASDFSDCDNLADVIKTNMEHRAGTYGTDVLIGSMMISESDDYIPSLNKYLITQEYKLEFD
jgi:hypothetical protein